MDLALAVFSDPSLLRECSLLLYKQNGKLTSVGSMLRVIVCSCCLKNLTHSPTGDCMKSGRVSSGSCCTRRAEPDGCRPGAAPAVPEVGRSALVKGAESCPPDDRVLSLRAWVLVLHSRRFCVPEESQCFPDAGSASIKRAAKLL